MSPGSFSRLGIEVVPSIPAKEPIIACPRNLDASVDSGERADPSTGTAVHFGRGDGARVDIDHVVALGNAWVTGAFTEPVRERAALANDPLNLLPVDSSTNRQKGDGDAATWLPPNARFRCRYVARQVAVKAKYDLWVTPPERAAITRVLDACPGQRLPADSGAPVLAPVRVTDPASPSASPGSGAFASCDAAQARWSVPAPHASVRRRGSAPDPGTPTIRTGSTRVSTRIRRVRRGRSAAPFGRRASDS